MDRKLSSGPNKRCVFQPSALNCLIYCCLSQRWGGSYYQHAQVTCTSLIYMGGSLRTRNCIPAIFIWLYVCPKWTICIPIDINPVLIYKRNIISKKFGVLIRIFRVIWTWLQNIATFRSTDLWHGDRHLTQATAVDDLWIILKQNQKLYTEYIPGLLSVKVKLK